MLPVFGANLLQALYGTVDLMVVGQFASTADVSAVSTFSAQNVGAGEYKRARSSMYLGMIWTFAVGLAVFLFSFSHGALLAVSSRMIRTSSRPQPIISAPTQWTV